MIAWSKDEALLWDACGHFAASNLNLSSATADALRGFSKPGKMKLVQVLSYEFHVATKVSAFNLYVYLYYSYLLFD
jgi:hypothetical protein